MKIAIPSKNNQVDDHFGHCEYFTVYTVNENKVSASENVPSLQTCGCKSNIIDILKEKGVDVMLAGNMGQGAFNKLTGSGMKVIRGCSGSVDALINDYLAGNVKDNLIMCEAHHHHGEGHQCNH